MAVNTKANVRQAIKGLRINQGITAKMLPRITFSPTLGITAGRIDKLGVDIRSFKVPLQLAIKEVIAPSIRKNFDSGGRPSWAPLSDATPEIQERVQGYGPHKTLIRSGKMRKVMSQLNVWTVTQSSAILDKTPDSVPYASVQQGGYDGYNSGSKKVGKGRSLAQIVNDAKKNAASRGAKGKGEMPANWPPTIPARPFVMLQPQDGPKVEAVFEKWLGERVAARWGRG